MPLFKFEQNTKTEMSFPFFILIQVQQEDWSMVTPTRYSLIPRPSVNGRWTSKMLFSRNAIRTALHATDAGITGTSTLHYTSLSMKHLNRVSVYYGWTSHAS